MSIDVRLARRDELERVNELRRVVNDLHVQGRPDIFRPGFSRELRQRVYDVFDSEDSDVVVAALDGRIAGFATVQYIRRPESAYNLARSFYHVEEFCVDPDCRRQGVATALVEFMRQDARAKGFRRIELDAWAFNEGALAFYQRVGFRPFRWFFEMDADRE